MSTPNQGSPAPSDAGGASPEGSVAPAPAQAAEVQFSSESQGLWLSQSLCTGVLCLMRKLLETRL